jgi:hypothetical protein
LRRGQSLVEFALVALVVYMLLAAILTFGHALYVAQGLQTAADLGAREISRTPLGPSISFDEALLDDGVRERIFDEAFLVLDLAGFYAANPDGSVFDDLVPRLPILNQQLAMLMIVDRPDLDGDGVPDEWLLRYPGALLSRTTPISPPMGGTYDAWVATEFAIGVPLVVNRTGADLGAPGGFETIRWVPVVEEIGIGSGSSPFPIESSHRGIVALRINFPFQSASMSSFQVSPGGAFEPTLGRPNAADDAGVTEVNAGDRPGGLTGAPLQGANGVYAGTYGGQFGLGAQGALGSDLFTGGRPVRPYRRVISGQAIYRREVFAN